jgi:internalin A
MWVLSSWGWAVTQAAEPSLRSSFEEWCQQKASLSAEARKTVEVLLEEAGTNDCELAANNVSSRTELYLSGNEITDLRPLAGLTNLKTLQLIYNQIADVTPLAGLTNLNGLHLSGNQIKDVTPLAGLTNLKALNLDYNQITDISPLAGLINLEWLYLPGNPITQPTCPITRPDVCQF